MLSSSSLSSMNRNRNTNKNNHNNNSRKIGAPDAAPLPFVRNNQGGRNNNSSKSNNNNSISMNSISISGSTKRYVVTPAISSSISKNGMLKTNGKHHSTTDIAPLSKSTKGGSSNSSNRFTVDKQIVDELLLVCGVIGTTTSTTTASDSNNHDNHNDNDDVPMIIPVTDCVQWLQDLQRCLRRDDDTIRTISILLYSWNIVIQKLLPLLLYTQYDTTLIITICKILVLLTKPLHIQTIYAGRMVINTKTATALSNGYVYECIRTLFIIPS
jgi:Timeless protein